MVGWRVVVWCVITEVTWFLRSMKSLGEAEVLEAEIQALLFGLQLCSERNVSYYMVVNQFNSNEVLNMLPTKFKVAYENLPSFSQF